MSFYILAKISLRLAALVYGSKMHFHKLFDLSVNVFSVALRMYDPMDAHVTFKVTQIFCENTANGDKVCVWPSKCSFPSNMNRTPDIVYAGVGCEFRASYDR